MKDMRRNLSAYDLKESRYLMNLALRDPKRYELSEDVPRHEGQPARF